MRCRKCLAGMCFIGYMAAAAAFARADEPVLVRGGHTAGMAIVSLEAEQFAQRENGSDAKLLDLLRWTDKQNLEQFAAGKCHVLVHRSMPTAVEMAFLENKFPSGTEQPEVFVMGYSKVAVVVNNENHVKNLNVEQIRSILSTTGSGKRWSALGGADSLVKCYSDRGPSRMVIRHACLMLGPEHPTGYYPFRKDLEACKSGEEILQKVRADRNGIGFLLYYGQPLKGVHALSITASVSCEPVPLKEGACLQEDYALQEPVLLYLRPGAPPLARKFCEFAVSADGSAIAEKCGLITAHAQNLAGSSERLAEMKAGKGERLSALGVMGGQKVVNALALEYVKAKAVVQVGWNGVDSDTAAVGGFLGGEGKQALLLLNDRPSVQALAALGERWEKVKPTEYLIAGRGAAIIVNPANQLASLTQDQVRGLFKGEIADWGLLGGTGLAASGNKAPITAYGLPAGDPVSAILQQEGVLVQSHQVTAKKDSAEVLAAVAADSQGIGVVDLAALPVGDKSVRVLAIQIGTGNKAELVPPTPDNLKNAMYPYAQRVYLYVHPQASDAAKDFAKFVATCGAAEATPYADTLKTTMDAYRKSGLIPLADPAIDRAAKEAFDAAKAESAKAGQKQQKDPNSTVTGDGR